MNNSKKYYSNVIWRLDIPTKHKFYDPTESIIKKLKTGTLGIYERNRSQHEMTYETCNFIVLDIENSAAYNEPQYNFWKVYNVDKDRFEQIFIDLTNSQRILVLYVPK